MAVKNQELVEQIRAAGARALEDLRASADSGELEQVRVRHLGKKSELARLQKLMQEVPAEQRREVGQALNDARDRFVEALRQRQEESKNRERDEKFSRESIDVTLPGRRPPLGRLHPLTITLREIEDIFVSMGFQIVLGPEMELEFYNFEALNIPADHPARDMHDTFYLKGGGLLRTHTSPVQIRTMLRRKPPLAIIAPGKVYRCDSDSTHSPMFQQVEGLVVDHNIHFSDLKGTLVTFIQRMLGDVKYRFRPSYFPFTEPSAEMDIFWKAEGREPAWMEVLGSGMVHPNVLEAGGCDPARYTGFAFGLGVERFAMLKYGVPNIMMFYQNDLRFLRQF